MTSGQRTTICAASILLFSMVGSVLLLHHVDEIRPRDIVDDTLYVASPKLLKRASLGFDGLMACIYWTRAVQYFGHRHLLRKTSYNELGPLLEITTALDPHLLPPYQFGSTFLAPAPPNGAGQPERAIRLMEYGIQNNPDNWRLYYDLGFIYYTELKDFKKAAEAFERGSQVPDAHPFLKVLAANTAQHAEDYATARLLWSAAYQNSNEGDIRQNALDHLRAIQVDEDVTNLQNAVTRFVEANKRIPTSLWEIAAAEHLAGIPVDPDGIPYELSIDGQVLVATPDDFPFIKKGTPPGYKPGPPHFHSTK
jgi:tetratricopeptide (TPR) repeat protein